VVDLEEMARELGTSVERLLSAAASGGVVAELVEHGHRAFLAVTRAGLVDIRVYRCGREDQGPVEARNGLDDLAAARAEAGRILAGFAVPQLDLFG